MHRSTPWRLAGPKSALRGGKNGGERFLARYLYRYRRKVMANRQGWRRILFVYSAVTRQATRRLQS
jgi:hypothetical protein